MTLHQLLQTISFALTDTDNLYHHLANDIEDKDIGGGVWWYVIAFKNEFDPEDYAGNEYQIYYTTDTHQDYNQIERLCISQGFTDIYTQILTKW